VEAGEVEVEAEEGVEAAVGAEAARSTPDTESSRTAFRRRGSTPVPLGSSRVEAGSRRPLTLSARPVQLLERVSLPALRRRMRKRFHRAWTFWTWLFPRVLSPCEGTDDFLVIYGAATPCRASLATRIARLAPNGNFVSLLSLFVLRLVATAQQGDAKGA
jgi:hypothetical protein